MRRTWPPTTAGSHYSTTLENVRLGEAEVEKEQEERHSCRIYRCTFCIYEQRGKEGRIWVALNRLRPLWGRLIKDWGCSMSPQGPASIWIFIELTLAFLATVYKRMPIGFYLVATNKPLCLTCIQTTSWYTETDISALPHKQPWNRLLR